METDILKETYASISKTIQVIKSNNQKDISIETCIGRYLKELNKTPLDKKLSKQQLGQVLSRDGSILVIQQYLNPRDTYFNEHELDLFLIRQFIIHTYSLGVNEEASVSRIRVESSAKQLLGLNQSFQEERTDDMIELLEAMHQEPLCRKKHPKSATIDGNYIPTLKEHLVSVYCDNLMYTEYQLAKEIVANGKEKELESLLYQIDHSREVITSSGFQNIPYQKKILA